MLPQVLLTTFGVSGVASGLDHSHQLLAILRQCEDIATHL